MKINFLLSLLVGIFVAVPTVLLAQAPLRTGQPYAEAVKCADPNVIFCEDFNYPENFIYIPIPGTGYATTDWINPGLTSSLMGFIYGAQGRRINLVTDYSARPGGAMPSGSQPDYVWAANWDPTKGAQGNGTTWAFLRNAGSPTYANGTAVSRDIYVRFQFYVTANYTWPGDPKTDIYAWGSSFPIDNKIFMLMAPEALSNPTSLADGVGLSTGSGAYDPVSGGRFADSLQVRFGDSGDNYKQFPLCPQCSSHPTSMYTPFQSLTLRNPNDTPLTNRLFRFNTNKWYTIEVRMKLSSAPTVRDGIVEIWIDGTKIYSQSNLDVCGTGLGDCTGLGLINIDAYHNGADTTVWNGQQVIDNLIISRSYIGPPGSTVAVAPPTPPQNLTVK